VVDQDTAWAEVRKKVNGASADDLAALQIRLRETARKYGLAIPETFSQAAEAAAAGIDKSELVRFVEMTTKASVGWDTTARETAQKLAEIKAGTGMTLPQMDDLANKINALGDNSAAKERDIVEMFHRSGAAAKAAGVQYDDTLAILTAVRSTGMQEEVASRWFNAFAFDLAGAHTKGDKVQDAWKLLGFDPKAISKGMTKDATGTIMKVFEAINKLDQMKKVEVLSKIFGQGWQDETARAAQALAEVRKQLDYIRNPKNWQGSLQQNIDIQQDTIANRWKRAAAAASDFANELDRGLRISKAFNASVDWLLDKFESVQKRKQELETKIKQQEEEIGHRAEAPGADADRLGPAVERRNQQRVEALEQRRRLQAISDNAASIEAAERDLAGAQIDAKRRPGVGGVHARVAADRLARLRMERAELELRGEAMKPRPELDLGPARTPASTRVVGPFSPRDKRNFTPAARPQFSPWVDAPRPTPPVMPLEDIVPRTAEGKVRASMDGLNRALAEGGEKAVSESKSIVDRIKELFGSLNFTVTPTISPRFGGGPAGGPGSAAPQPQSAPAPASGGPLQRQARAGGLVITGPVSFHGIRDIASAHRELTRLADRDVEEARDSALHDTWSYA
jgi:TP901 family phage tail tape measure protein